MLNEIKNKFNSIIICSGEKPIKELAQENKYNLSRADLSRADLSRANLSRANLSRANLSRADLSRADLSRANLSDANLSRADLSHADLSYANLSRADLFDITINWQSHDLIAELLKREADTTDKLMIAGLILIAKYFCWKDFLAIEHKEKDWAMGVLKKLGAPLLQDK